MRERFGGKDILINRTAGFVVVAGTYQQEQLSRDGLTSRIKFYQQRDRKPRRGRNCTGSLVGCERALVLLDGAGT